MGNEDSWNLKIVICIVWLLPKSPWRFDQRDLPDVTKTRASADVAVVMACLMYVDARWVERIINLKGCRSAYHCSWNYWCSVLCAWPVLVWAAGDTCAEGHDAKWQGLYGSNHNILPINFLHTHTHTHTHNRMIKQQDIRLTNIEILAHFSPK